MDSITILCSNVRTSNAPIDLGNRKWMNRFPYFKKWLDEASADIIGFQEVTKGQMEDLTSYLTDYDFVFEYRDKKKNSEACPIFYKKEKFELLKKGFFWLSNTPNKMSKGWHAACYRICSYVILKEKETNKELVVFNTHLDHISVEARIKGIQLVLDKIKEFNFMDKASILMGDMNDFDDSITINALFSDFKDASYVARDDIRYHCTYMDFGDKLDEKRIDYFAIRNLNVISYNVITTLYDGIYASDHFPILLKISLA